MEIRMTTKSKKLLGKLADQVPSNENKSKIAIPASYKADLKSIYLKDKKLFDRMKDA